MIIVGIDLSSVKTGVAIVERDAYGNCNLIETRIIITHSTWDIGRRLDVFEKAMLAIWEEFQPDIIVREGGFVHGNRATKILYKFYGVLDHLYYEFRNGEKKMNVYMPKAVKKAVTGNGNSSKQQVADALPRWIHMDNPLEYSDDETDAIAVALTFLKDIEELRSLSTRTE
ncbi:crossover junction endodeoxyribonuclease [Listeria phage LP-032]|uniref:Crossover junction endodeoxyribonuclease n=11 Tax=Homburgvirus TaxID=1921125 RepID=A0A6C0R0K7_9CAUD|nr:RuvC-like Holliday junction resolvase [Listeria phage P70]YP_008240463.1 RuvC-like Holliday junction resolvase [Listeria phage LP-110]YP_008240495.1 RuvC-like Holliday junction resolvase [Listeria phage LP-037]YP_009044105.1 RuvC-like Holliday junction resolvase [Listeria phage LP-026]YP_009045076.1 RuvC-like Holliday junction resolvase [Listeria phage LP-114]AHL18879.1 crossover junction endodeoxyribonuclease [Listeria phage LP-032]AWY07681.1 crossover junction endodeoxyribonuclease [List